MLDLEREQRIIKQRTQKQDNLLNLTETQPHYACEDCDVELVLFLQGAEYFPMERGPHYICPECHIVTDISQTKPPGMDEIKPIDIEPPTFVVIPDDKGDRITIPVPYDPEPDEEQWLKNIGATLIEKRIEVKSDLKIR